MYLLEMKIADLLLAFLIHSTDVLVVIAQYNLTPFGTATQSSSFSSNYGRPEFAINPPISNTWNFTLCSHTHVDNSSTIQSWWMFQFSFGSAFITDITIYYREGYYARLETEDVGDFENVARRMDGFKLCVTNTSTIPPESDVCYEDPDPGFPNITQTINFNHLGKFVIYYDNKGSTETSGRIDGPVIELCYVAINGCQKNFWGNNCESSCAENCIESSCFPGNGSCIWGCNPIDCLHDICNKVTAVCTDGCKERRTGNHCNKYNLASYSLVTQIPSGSVPASLAIDGDKFSCSRTKGSSVTFQVDLMEASVVTGILLTFGEINSTEGDHAVYASNTSSGWKSGTVLYKEKTLPTEIDFFSIFRYLTYVPPGDSYTSFEICEIGVIGCPPTHYGHLCSRSCPKNCKGPCDLESGSCIFGCINGWTGNTCARACNSGRHGENCVEECSANCLIPQCNHETGECINGCKDGWQGLNCIQKCSTGQFGKNCSEFCEGCLSRMCSNVDGLCENTTACNPGYIYEEYCNKTCDMWHFGKNCTKNCYCLRGPCNVFTGDCPSGGCKNGWQGESCDEVSTKSGSVAAADNSVISTQIGLFIGGFLLGALTMLATYLLVIIKRKLRTKQGKEKETDKTQSNGQQQYDDVQMENVSSTYQELMTHQTRPTSNDYDQINTVYVNQ